MIEEYIDIGVDILNPVQPECNDFGGDREAFRGRFPSGAASVRKHHAVWHSRRRGSGGSSPGQGDAGSRRRTAGRPTHILEPEVPWDNVVAFVEAARNAFYE